MQQKLNFKCSSKMYASICIQDNDTRSYDDQDDIQEEVL